MIPAKTVEIASRLGVDASWLDRLIQFESGYDPLIKNRTSSARGLIQLTDTAAREKPFSASDSLSVINRFPSFDSQMENVVYPYLKKYVPYPTKQSLYMAVFYPAYRYYDIDKQFPLDVQRANTVKTSGGYITIRTPRDYGDMVEGNSAAVLARTAAKGLPPPDVGKTAGGLAMILFAAGVWFLYNYIKRGHL